MGTEGDYNACAISALYGLNSFQAGSAYYTQGLNIINSFIGKVPRIQDQELNMPKLDWQINDRNRFSVMYNRMRDSSPDGLYSQTTGSSGRSNWGNDNVKEDYVITRLTSVLSNSMFNEAVVQYGRDFEFDHQDPPLPNELPMAQNAFGHAAQTEIGYYFNNGIYTGSNPDLPRVADPDERRLQLLDGLTWNHGRHNFRFGVEYNKALDYDNNLYNGNGEYSYNWSYDFIADYLNATTGIGGPIYTPSNATTTCATAQCYHQLYYSFGQTFGSAAGEIATREYAGYANDDWRISPTLTLTLGVRYEYEYVPPSPFVNTGNAALAADLAALTPLSPLPPLFRRPPIGLTIVTLSVRALVLPGMSTGTIRPHCAAGMECITGVLLIPISSRPTSNPDRRLLRSAFPAVWAQFLRACFPRFGDLGVADLSMRRWICDYRTVYAYIASVGGVHGVLSRPALEESRST